MRELGRHLLRCRGQEEHPCARGGCTESSPAVQYIHGGRPRATQNLRALCPQKVVPCPSQAAVFCHSYRDPTPGQQQLTGNSSVRPKHLIAGCQCISALQSDMQTQGNALFQLFQQFIPEEKCIARKPPAFAAAVGPALGSTLWLCLNIWVSALSMFPSAC